MRVVYLAKNAEKGPSSWYRIYQFQRYFDVPDIDLEILPSFSNAYLGAEAKYGFGRRWDRWREFAKGAVRRLGHTVSALRADVVAIERESFPRGIPFIEMLLATFKKGYVLEFDDAIYLSLGRRIKYPMMLRMANQVIVGNETLARYARQYNSNVVVVPTCVDLHRYPIKSCYRLSVQPRLGWVGLPANFHHLREMEPSLLHLSERYHSKLVVISARRPEVSVPMEFIAWSRGTEVQHILQFDIGVMPLKNTDFAAGKCGLKCLQYMAAGVPVVASGVGVNRDMIEHGVNGFLVDTLSDWRRYLDLLLQDEDLRRSMGQAGRATVEQHYSTKVWGPRLVHIYRSGQPGQANNAWTA